MKSYDHVSYAVDRVLEPFMRSARQCLMIGTDTTLDQEWGTDGNCVCMSIVHCRVIVDNKCEFEKKEKRVKFYKKKQFSILKIFF